MLVTLSRYFAETFEGSPQQCTYPSNQKTMIKIRIVEIQPPPYFHAAAPARIERNGPSIPVLLVSAGRSTMNSVTPRLRPFAPAWPYPCGSLDSRDLSRSAHCVPF